MGFRVKWIKWIFALLDFEKFYILVNDNPTKEVFTKGIPFLPSSSLVFVVVEGLKYLCWKPWTKWSVKGINLYKNGTYLDLFQHINKHHINGKMVSRQDFKSYEDN